jgi:hypothetical protein
LFDQYGNPSKVGLSGITLSLDANGKSVGNAVTDANGHYAFSNITTGSYSLAANSPSTTPPYGAQYGVFQYLADTLTRNINMSAQANFSPSNVIAHSNSVLAVDSLYIYVATPDSQTRSVIIFLGNSSAVSSTNYLYAKVVNINVNATLVKTTIHASTLYDLGLASGATAYYAVYGEPVSDKSVYVNLKTGQNTYTALSSANVVVSTLVP